MPDLVIDRVTPTRLSEQVASRIEAIILERRLRPGEKLPSERELSARFGVSRAIVRESIKLLEERGLLRLRNGRGAFVTAPSPDNLSSALNVAFRMQGCSIAHMYEARWHLESVLVGIAAERANDADIARMELAIESMNANLSDRQRYMLADVEFHLSIAAASHNPLFVAMVQPLISVIQDLGVATWPRRGNYLERHECHGRIVECIKSRNAVGATEALRQHLTLTRLAAEEAAAEEAEADIEERQ